MFITSWSETGAFTDFYKSVKKCKNLINIIFAELVYYFQPFNDLPKLSQAFQNILSLERSS